MKRGLSQLGQGIILLEKTGLAVKEGCLIGVIDQDNDRLQKMHEIALQDANEDPNYLNFFVHRLSQHKPYLLMMSKIECCENSSGVGECVLIIVKDTHANSAFWQERLKNLFGLTNREAYFAVYLTEGRDIKEISLVIDIAEDTARQYLKNCFKKMNVNKQHELVCLVLDSLRKR